MPSLSLAAISSFVDRNDKGAASTSIHAAMRLAIPLALLSSLGATAASPTPGRQLSFLPDGPLRQQTHDIYGASYQSSSSSSPPSEEFHGQRLVRLSSSDLSHLRAVHHLANERGFDVWASHRAPRTGAGNTSGGSLDIRLPAANAQEREFRELLRDAQTVTSADKLADAQPGEIAIQTLVHDLQTLVEETRPKSRYAAKDGDGGDDGPVFDDTWHDDYHEYDE